MTKQELFDKVVNHLRAQGRAAVTKAGSCMYRAPDGTQCAVGCLISDEHYDESLEFKNMGTPTAKPGTPEAFPILFYPVLEAVQKSIGRELEQDEVGMLGRLQTIHDCHGPDSWRQSLKSLARDLGLTTPWGQP